jgi:hypothetical protein
VIERALEVDGGAISFHYVHTPVFYNWIAVRRSRMLALALRSSFKSVALAGGWLLLGLCPAATASPANVRVGPAPPAAEQSRDFTVTIEGKAVPVYAVKVAPADPARRSQAMDDVANSAKFFDIAAFASFDMNGPVQVTVACPAAIQSAKILPSSAGIVPTVAAGKVTFSLDRPRLLTIEINGQWASSLHLFANPFEAAPPRPHAPGVIYFGPGIYELPEGLRVHDNQTVYIAAGAILRGVGTGKPVISLEGKNIKLRGRGIIDGSLCPTHSSNLFYIHGSDISVEGVILRDASTWNMPIRQSDRVTIQNVKVLGYRANSDGIDVCNSRDVLIDGCFLRTLDDLIVVKSDKGQGPVQHVVARNCVLWNQVAHALSIGAELRENVDDVLFTNCDVIHDTGREWTLRIYHCDSALVSNVRFENIRIEQSTRPISLWIGKTKWSVEDQRGNIRGVTFKDISGSAAVPLDIELAGFDATHDIQDVHFENVRFNGQPLTRAQVRCNPFVEGVSGF